MVNGEIITIFYFEVYISTPELRVWRNVHALRGDVVLLYVHVLRCSFP